MSNENHPPLRSHPQFRRIIRLGVVGVGAAVVLAVVLIGAAEYHTGQSSFCGSCHIMVPYYKSWQKDVHSGKGHAQCIDCHYVPGERHTIHAKLRGLSQLVSYVSGRTGGARPRPKVQDASCLREGCHSVEKIADVKYPIKDVQFTHAKHLKANRAEIDKNSAHLVQLTAQLATRLDNTTWAAVQQAALQVGNPEANQQAIRRLIGDVSTDPRLKDLGLQYALAVHRDIRLRQMDNLRCTTCHAHNDDANHFSVRREVCFTCHFTNQVFNTDTGKCLSCHSPPAIRVPVHGQVMKVSAGMATAVAGQMDHSVIVANNVNCVTCHADLIVGTGEVTRRRCSACHDQAEYFEKFDKHLDTRAVNDLHTTHISHLYASCNECHEDIRHRLEAKGQFLAKGEFLAPVLDNCAHCHPNHHHRQVEMYAGRAPGHLASGAANAMFGSRVNCLSCHTKSAEDQKGLPVIEATKEACIVCHSRDYYQLFDQWLSRLKAGVKDAHDLEGQVTALLKALGPNHEGARQAAQCLAKGREALDFVEMAKGIHNRNYALELLDYALDQFTQAIHAVKNPTTQASTGLPASASIRKQ